MIVYLCGPINGCTDNEASDWREEAKKHLPQTIDPMRRDYRGRELEAYRDVVELDKIDVSKCDVLLVNYIKPSVGTAMEILYGWERGKMIVTVAPRDATLSPWLIYHSHKIFHSFGEAFAFLCGLTSTE